MRGLDDPRPRGSPDQPRRARLGRPRGRLRRAARLPRLADEPAMREFFELADDRRRGPPRALARGASTRPEQEVISGATRPRSRGSTPRATTAPRSCAAPMSRASRGYDGAALRAAIGRAAAGDLVFIGGTGRSGTHVLARLLGPASALRRRPDRVPLSLQQAGHAGPARGPGRRWPPSSTSCATSGGTASGSTASRAASTTC